MKIVKNYKRLKKWAKTLFVTLLTICILFTSTGVATLFAYADPTDDSNEINEQFNTESGSETTPSIAPQEHEHVYVTSYESNNDGTHKVIKTCECEDKIEETEICSMVNGTCSNCGYTDANWQSENTNPMSSIVNNAQQNEGNGDDSNRQNLRKSRGISSPPENPNDAVGGQIMFAEGRIFSTNPTNGTVKKYNKSSQVLFSLGTPNTGFIYNSSTTYTVKAVHYFIYKKLSDNQYTYLGNETQISQTEIGDYSMLVTADLESSEQAVDRKIGQIYNASIVKGDITDGTITPTSPANYTAYKTSGGFTITGLEKDVDFTVDSSQLPSAPTANSTYSVTLTGIGNYEGTLTAEVNVGDISVLFDNAALHTAAYNEQVVISATGYSLSYSEAGPFDGSITYTEPGENQSVILYFQDNNGNVIKKTIEGLNVKTSIPIKFNGSTEKNDSYLEKVDITADGYTISTSNSGPFSSKYTHNIVGENQVIQLYFRSDQTGTVKSKTITGITILPKDVTAIGESTGKIIVGNYSSDKIAATENTVYKTSDSKSIEIQATNESAGIKSIEYATSNEAYNTVSDILGAVIDKKMNWKPYSNDSKPTFPKDSALYVYARITDNNGNYNYLSTGKIIHDTIDPEITNAILAAKEDGSNENVLAITAKDSLSGIKEFYMLYEEKNSKSEVPKKSKIIEDGKNFDVDTNDGENAGGSYKLSDLIEDTTYIFYIVAKDEVGNISEIKTIESKGKGSNSAEVSGSSSDQSKSKSGNGLAPAPNGIAGSGNTKTPKTGTTNIPQKTNKEEKISPLEREINRVPYISDATGDTKIGIDATGGWDKITNEVKNSSSGISMDIEMSGFSVVPDKVFTQMKGKDLNVKFLLPEKVQWIINGQNIESTSGTDLDMGVRIGAKNIPNDMLTPVVGSYPHTEIELKHNGKFGFSGILRIPLGESNAGLYAYLYYYDTKEKEMKFMQSTQISSTGYAEFSFNHASDYTIVIRSEEMMTAQAVKTDKTIDGTNTYDDNTSAYKTFKLTDFAGSRASVRAGTKGRRGFRRNLR